MVCKPLKPGMNETECVSVRANKVSKLLWRSSDEDVPWMLGVADLVKGVNRGTS